MKTGKPRITEVAHCCRQNYSRWRFADQPFSDRAGGHVTCFICSKPLTWKPPVKRQSAPNPFLATKAVGPAPALTKISAREAAWRKMRESMNITPPADVMLQLNQKSFARYVDTITPKAA